MPKKENEKNRSKMTGDIRKTVIERGKVKQNINKRKIAKLLIWVAICIIVVLSLIVVIKKVTKTKIPNGEIIEEKYFITTINGKTGVIDKSGNTIIEPTYEYIQIPNPSKPIFICLYDYNASNREYSSKVLNDKGEEIYKNFDFVQSLATNNTTNDYPYQTNILKYKKDNKYGILTIDGNQVTDAIYDSIEVLKYKDDVIKVSVNNKYGLIKIDGEKIVNTEYDNITADGYYNEKTNYEFAGYIVSTKTNEGYRFGYINNKGKVLLEDKYNQISRINEIIDDDNVYLLSYQNGQAGLNRNSQTIINNEYEDIEYDNTNGLVSIQKSNKYGIYNMKGEEILPIQYDSIIFVGKYIDATKDGETLVFDANGNKQSDDSYLALIPTKNSKYYITIDRNNNYGVANSNNISIVENKYAYIEYAFDNYFIVSKDGKSGLVDDIGRTILDIKYQVVQTIKGTNILQTISNNEKINIYNRKINQLIETSDLNAIVEDNYVEITSLEGIYYYDLDGNDKNAKEIYTNNKIFASEKDGKWGYVDEKGNTVIDYLYDVATNVNSYGYGAVKKDGKWGSIDSNGNSIIEPTYVLSDKEPTFIGKYYKVNNGYEIPYYTNKQ